VRSLSTEPILFVDDEPNILAGIRRTLAGYQVKVAGSGAEGLELVEQSVEDAPFAVVVSDMMMPGMNGAEFLRRVRELLPDAVLLILSGQADLPSTIAAVNDASLFRFLSKPCSPEDLRRALEDALRQHELVLAERELLQRTLSESVGVLVQVLSIANPEAFSRADRVRAVVDRAVPELGLEADWELRIAAMLSQIGCVAVPEQIMERVRLGEELSPADLAIYAGHPDVARGLVVPIPRLERVAAWIAEQPVLREPESLVAEAAGWDRAQAVLYAALFCVEALDRATPALQVGKALRPLFEADVVAAVTRAAFDRTGRPTVTRKVAAAEITIGMTLLTDLLTTSGMVLVRGGEEVTPTLLVRLRNFASTTGIAEPVLVGVKAA
jgi:CheY-like chemotaxis protein